MWRMKHGYTPFCWILSEMLSFSTFEMSFLENLEILPLPMATRYIVYVPLIWSRFLHITWATRQAVYPNFNKKKGS